jgi:hypothetical protein
MSTQLSNQTQMDNNSFFSKFKSLEVKIFILKCLKLQLAPIQIDDYEKWHVKIEDIPKLDKIQKYKTKESLTADYLFLFLNFSKDEKLFNLIEDLVKSCFTPHDFIMDPRHAPKFKHPRTS